MVLRSRRLWREVCLRSRLCWSFAGVVVVVVVVAAEVGRRGLAAGCILAVGMCHDSNHLLRLH